MVPIMFKSFYGDKTPWAEGGDLKTARRFASPDDTRFKTSYYPRPEFDALQVNRILQEFREEYRWVLNWEAFMDEWVEWLTNPQEIERIWKNSYDLRTDAEITHARKVILRLRSLR
jgi:hypothetical protein